MYGNQLDGLCGNCNDEKEDDFRTISGEIVFTETIFFTSWVIYDYSLDAVIIDTGRLSSAYTLIEKNIYYLLRYEVFERKTSPSD